MTKYQTEPDLLVENHIQVARLVNLYHTQRNLFYEVAEYLPFVAQISHRSTLDTVYGNKVLENWLEVPIDEIIKGGYSFLKKLTDPIIHDNTLRKLKAFNKTNDKGITCGYFERVKCGNKLSWFYVHTLILDEDNFLNLGYRMDHLGGPGAYIEDLLGEILLRPDSWRRFQSLTLREKEILIRIARGVTTRDISQELFISELTAKTHRRNMMKKMNVKNLSEAIRFGQAIQLLGL